MHRKSRINPLLLTRAREMPKNAAPAEKILWSCLRNRQLGGFKFRRQYSIDHYIIDFYCAEQKLGVELDGDSHSEREDYDERRTAALATRAIEIARFPNTDVFENLEGLLEFLLDRLTSAHPLTPP